jgi:hypothetical protein
VRNQSALFPGYTSLVTDFDAYLASNPVHEGTFASALWQSAAGHPTGNFDFDLGGTFTIQSLALWNLGGAAASAVNGFDLLASADPSFSSATLLGSFNANSTGVATAAPAQVFTFTPTSAAFVRMVITSNHGGTNATSFGEAAFEVQSSPTAVPAPPTLLLGLVGAGCVARLRRKPAGA